VSALLLLFYCIRNIVLVKTGIRRRFGDDVLLGRKWGLRMRARKHGVYWTAQHDVDAFDVWRHWVWTGRNGPSNVRCKWGLLSRAYENCGAGGGNASSQFLSLVCSTIQHAVNSSRRVWQPTRSPWCCTRHIVVVVVASRCWRWCACTVHLTVWLYRENLDCVISSRQQSLQFAPG